MISFATHHATLNTNSKFCLWHFNVWSHSHIQDSVKEESCGIRHYIPQDIRNTDKFQVNQVYISSWCQVQSRSTANFHSINFGHKIKPGDPHPDNLCVHQPVQQFGHTVFRCSCSYSKIRSPMLYVIQHTIIHQLKIKKLLNFKYLKWISNICGGKTCY